MNAATQTNRVYLDWNASAPLRPEARAAMLSAMMLCGNPSSVHAEGRAARAVLEQARDQVAALAGCASDEVIFTSGATEAANMALRGAKWDAIAVGAAEHDAVWRGARAVRADTAVIPVGATGVYERQVPADVCGREAPIGAGRALICLQAANGETGAVHPAPQIPGGVHLLRDATQVIGRAEFDFPCEGGDFTILSAHKLGGPRGVGALILRRGRDLTPLLPGGGQETRRRAGTENVVGAAGFGAAAQAARRDLSSGVWRHVADLRGALEDRLRAAAPDAVILRSNARLPNTCAFAVAGWRAETQVMQLDLAGFAVSAGSACSSGKVGASRALAAMGLSAEVAASAIRVSLGPTTTWAEVERFADVWTHLYRRRRARAA